MASLRNLKAVLLQTPSARLNPFERGGRRVRLLATTMVRNEQAFVPGMLRNVGPQVDGIVALDDGSSDGTDRLLEQSPYVVELLRNPPDRAAYDEPEGHRRLVAAALRHGADWILSVDADERLERDFADPGGIVGAQGRQDSLAQLCRRCFIDRNGEIVQAGPNRNRGRPRSPV